MTLESWIALPSEVIFRSEARLRDVDPAEKRRRALLRRVIRDCVAFVCGEASYPPPDGGGVDVGEGELFLVRPRANGAHGQEDGAPVASEGGAPEAEAGVRLEFHGRRGEKLRWNSRLGTAALRPGRFVEAFYLPDRAFYAAQISGPLSCVGGRLHVGVSYVGYGDVESVDVWRLRPVTSETLAALRKDHPAVAAQVLSQRDGHDRPAEAARRRVFRDAGSRCP